MCIIEFHQQKTMCASLKLIMTTGMQKCNILFSIIVKYLSTCIIIIIIILFTLWLGHVVDDDVKYPITLQEEVSNFNKKLLFPIDFEEPSSFVKLGR